MIELIIKILKRIIYAFLLIYSYDLIFNSLNLTVPLNYYTIPIVVILGFPGLLMLSLSFFFFI